MKLLKLSTARNILVFMTDAADHVTGDSGLTLTITASKDGAAFASISPTVTDLGSGWYSLALTSSHTDTLGDLGIHVTGSGCDPSDLSLQVVADLPGATVASVTGAVGSVTGAVGSVTGAVGSVTGNVGGNVTGTVGSVVGAVGSVTGNLGGNVAGTVASVVGAVGSVTAEVTISAASVQAIWDALTSALTTIGSIGKLIVTNLDAAITSRMATFVYTAAPTAVAIRTEMDSNSTKLANLDATTSSRLATAGYAAPDNTGIADIKAKTDNLPSDPADQNLVIAATNAIVALVGAPAGASVSADIAAIKSVDDAIKLKTDNLPTDPADQSLVIAATDAIYSRVGAPAGASVSADIAAVKVDSAAIKVIVDLNLDAKVSDSLTTAEFVTLN